MRTCNVPGCGRREGEAKGMCPMHYQRVYHHGVAGPAGPRPGQSDYVHWLKDRLREAVKDSEKYGDTCLGEVYLRKADRLAKNLAELAGWWDEERKGMERPEGFL